MQFSALSQNSSHSYASAEWILDGNKLIWESDVTSDGHTSETLRRGFYTSRDPSHDGKLTWEEWPLGQEDSFEPRRVDTLQLLVQPLLI